MKETDSANDNMPEYSLLVRRMELAIQDATSKHDNDERRQAQRWIFGLPTNNKLSAEYIADIMGLDIELIREAVKNRPASVNRLISQSVVSMRAQHSRKPQKDQHENLDA